MQRAVAKALDYQVFIGRMMAMLACVCALCAFLYAAFLLEAVAHAAARTSAERQIGDINGQLGNLEGQYLTLTQALTPERAQALGYVTPQNITTVYAAQSSPRLSLAAPSAVR